MLGCNSQSISDNKDNDFFEVVEEGEKTNALKFITQNIENLLHPINRCYALLNLILKSNFVTINNKKVVFSTASKKTFYI